MDGEFGMICELYIIRKCNLGGSYSFFGTWGIFTVMGYGSVSCGLRDVKQSWNVMGGEL